MSAPRDCKPQSLVPANDNEPVGGLKAELNFPGHLPIQLVEVEVLAELLDALPLPANDNKEGES